MHRVPDAVEVIIRHVFGQRQAFQRPVAGEQFGHHAGQNQQVIALADDGGGGHIALAVDRDGATEAQGLQIAIQARLRGAKGRVEHVGHLDKLRQADALGRQRRVIPTLGERRGRHRQIGAHQPGQRLGEPGLLAQIPRHLHVFVKAQHQVYLAACQLGFGQSVAQDADLDGDPGRQSFEALDKRRDQHALHVIRGAEHEAALRLARLEHLLVAELLLQQSQRLLYTKMQPLGARGRQHPLRGAHQERIAKEGAQTIERMAHGGLADKEGFGGAGDAALRHQGVKGEQQVEVELVQFHQDYLPGLWDNPSYSFDGCERNFLHCDHCYFPGSPRRVFTPAGSQSMQGALR